MANELDKKVQELYNVIQAKKAKIAKIERPNYKTNLSFPTSLNDDSRRINLQVYNDIPSLIIMLANLQTTKIQFDNISEELDIKAEFMYGGYKFEDWKHDFIAIINKVNIKKEKDDLASKESKLNLLVSPEEKRRLDIEALAKELVD